MSLSWWFLQIILVLALFSLRRLGNHRHRITFSFLVSVTQLNQRISLYEAGLDFLFYFAFLQKSMFDTYQFILYIRLTFSFFVFKRLVSIQETILVSFLS